MSSAALAAFLKPLVWPAMSFVGLLLVRWAAIVVMRLMPQSRLKTALFDKGLLDRRPWLHLAVIVAATVAVFWYASSFY